MRLTNIKEGNTDLIVPKETVAHSRGPGTYKKGVFFNPVMEFSRDASILVMREFVKKRKTKLLDGLAGTGARGVRIGNEVKGNFHMVINDHNPVALELIEKNITLNSLKNCEAKKKKMNSLLSEEDFDYVDIDPFGSPVQFIDSSLQAIRTNGMIALTATDTAPLCGTYPKTCLRRYGAMSLKTIYSKEIGARILSGHCVRLAGKYDIALTPFLTFFADHYIRIHFGVKKGAKKANSVLESIGFIHHEFKTGERRVEKDIALERSDSKLIGPLWIGNLHEKSFLKNMIIDQNLGTAKRLDKFLGLWKNEANLPPFFYDINEIARLTKTQPKPLQSIIEGLKDIGFSASGTHFSPNGFKTDADIKEVKRSLKI